MGTMTLSPSALLQQIDIIADHATDLVAPASIRLRPDLSNADFANTETYDAVKDATYDADYRPDLANLTIIWDVNEVGTFDKPTNMLDAFRGRGSFTGPYIDIPLSEAKTYRFGLLVYEASTGRYGVKTIERTVQDPDAFFSGTDTICVNLFGDSDFTGAPAGADPVNLGDGETVTNASAFWSATQSGNPKRVLFKGGSTYDVQLSRIGEFEVSGLTLGSYGTGRAIWSRDANQSFISYREGSGYLVTKLHGIEMQGGYDASASSVTAAASDGVTMTGGVSFARTGDLLIYDCIIDGVCHQALNYQPSDLTAERHVLIADSILRELGGQYPIINGECTHPTYSFSMVGSEMTRSVAGSTDDTAEMRGMIRVNHSAFCFIWCNDIYGHVPHNTTLKTDFGTDLGCVYNVGRNCVEGPNEIIAVGNPGADSTGTFVFDGNITIGGAATNRHYRVGANGAVVRNNLMFQPSTAYSDKALWDFVDVHDEFDPLNKGPQTIHNNSMAMMRDTAGNQSITPDINLRGYPYATQHDSLYYLPNLDTPVIGATNLDTSSLGITPRFPGLRPRATMVLDAAYASSGDDVISLQPLTGSTAIGAGSESSPTGPSFASDLAAAFASHVAATNDEVGCWSA